jgi:serine/threonine protein kinase
VAATLTRIGNFEVLRQIASGGMGAVYLGQDPELNRPVAIKVIREEVHDQEVLDRFFREARAAAALRHPNVITIYASGQHEHRPYMVMEFVDGESLADIVKSRPALPVAAKLSYLEQMCAGLHFAHRAGIIHRDVKPANVMVDKDGVVRILDFGIARIEGSAMTQDGILIGSLNYMSPEQMLGKAIDHRSDIFSVGSVAYELLSYQQAFKGNLNDGLLQRLPYEDPPPLSDICPGLPAGLEGVIVRALQKSPEDRFQDLAEMRNALLDIQRRFETIDEQRTAVISRTTLPSAAAGEPFSAPTSDPSSMQPYDSAPEPPLHSSDADAAPPSILLTPPPVAAQPPAAYSYGLKKKPTDSGTSVRPEMRPPTGAMQPAETAVGPRRRSWWTVIGLGAAALIVGVAVAIPWLTAAPPAPFERESPGLQAAMERFRIGYRNRDMDAVVAAFPELPQDLRQRMDRTFRDCLVYEVTFDRMTISLAPTDPTMAEADVDSTHTCTPHSGPRDVTTREHNVYTLQKNGRAWVLSGVSRRGSSGRPN